MRTAAIYAVIWLALGLLFLFAPGIDIAASRLFYFPAHWFPLADWTPVQAITAAIPWLTRLIVLLCAVAAVWLVVTHRPLWRLDRKALVFIVAATALGPGLIANTLLKDHWGRARPYQIQEFGGARQFTPAPLPTSQCERNCAFVSGHAALGFSLVSFALLLPVGPRRRIAIAAALCFGALVGVGRIAAGHHFLSDVLYAGLIVCAVSWLLHRLIVVHDVFGSPAAMRLYHAPRQSVAAILESLGLRRGPAALWIGAFAIFEAGSILWLDRPIAMFFHDNGEPWRPIGEVVQRLGFGTPYLVLFAASFAGLRWGGYLPALRAWGPRLRAAASVPAFLFAAVAASGLIVDLLKVVFGRARPKLLFAAGTYDFTWLGLGANYWSFPSGHAATAAALMTALWCLWPRHLLFYIALAAMVAASRVVIGAHYLSDVVMGAFIAVLVTRALAALFVHFKALPLPLARPGPPEPVLPPP
jgi:lipid A 4'-phosphatase